MSAKKEDLQRFPRRTRFSRFKRSFRRLHRDDPAVENWVHAASYEASHGYAELWWCGGDSGVPLYAYAVTERGHRPLAKLSRPREDPGRWTELDDAFARFRRIVDGWSADQF